MSDIVLIKADELRVLIAQAVKEGTHNKDIEVYYSTKQLAKIFGYQEATWRKWISSGKVGQQDFNGTCKATYNQAKEFLFQEKQLK